MREKRTPLKSISFNALSRIEVPSLSLMKSNPFLFPKPSAISLESVEITKTVGKHETTVSITSTTVVNASPPSTPPLTPSGAQAQSGALSDSKASDEEKGDQPLTEVQIHMLKAIRNHGGAAPLSHIQDYVAKIWGKLRKRDGTRYTYDYRRVISASLANTSNANPLFEKHGTRVGWWTIGQRGKGIELDENDNVIVSDGTVVVPDKIVPEVESEEEEEEDDEDDAEGDDDMEDDDDEDEDAAEEEEGSPYKGKKPVPAKRGRPKNPILASSKIKNEEAVSPDHASSDVSSNLSVSNESVHGDVKDLRRKPVRRAYVPPPPVPEVMTSRESRKLLEISRRIEQKDRLEREKAEAMLSPKRRRASGGDTPIKSEKDDKRKGDKLKRAKEDSKSSDREDDRPVERRRGRPPKAEKKRKREDEEELTRRDKEPLNRERRGKRRSGQKDDLSDSQQSDDKDNDIDQTLAQLQVIVGLAISENNGSASMDFIVDYVKRFVKTFRWSVNGKRGFQRRVSEEPYVDEDTLLAAIESSLNDKGNFVSTKKDNSKEGCWVLNKKFLSPASLKSLAPSFEVPDQSTNSPRLSGDSSKPGSLNGSRRR